MGITGMAINPSIDSLLIIGLLFLAILLVRLFVKLRWLPPMLAFLLIGLATNSVISSIPFIEHTAARTVIKILGEAGLVMLLFKVGINADLKGLKSQLPNAVWIWLWNVVISGGFGFFAANIILNLDLLTSLFVAIAFTATSVGITVSLWSDAGKLSTKQGTLLVDIAELDDLSTICLVAMLVAIVPLYKNGEAIQAAEVFVTLAEVVLLLAAFAVSAWFFSLRVEPRITRLIARRAIDHEVVIFMLAVGFIVAALAEVAGLSLAIGAFIAGLAFSRDLNAVEEQPVLNGLYDFLTPFFFISLGMMIELDHLQGLLWIALVLVFFAVSGKILGVMLPAWPRLGLSAALLLGVSMVPRMEIAMVVMQKGLAAGVSSTIFSAMILVSFITVLLTMLGLPLLLRRSTLQ